MAKKKEIPRKKNWNKKKKGTIQIQKQEKKGKNTMNKIRLSKKFLRKNVWKKGEKKRPRNPSLTKKK